jgi:hypothetical protein
MTPCFSDVEQSGLWLSHIANLYSGGQVGERDIEQAMRAFPEFLNTVFESKRVLPQQRWPICDGEYDTDEQALIPDAILVFENGT